MKKPLSFAIVLLIITSTLSTSSKVPGKGSARTKPTIYLVGSVHNMHFEKSSLYSVNNLLEQIGKLKPDVVCGEIAPEAFNRPMEGYYPPEAALLAEMSNKLGYKFIPVDWRLDYATQNLASNFVPEQTKKKRADLLVKIKQEIKSNTSVSLYDKLHSKTILYNLDSLYERVIGVDPLSEISSGSWHERNRRIVENAQITPNDSKIYVFVFGIDHLPQLKRQLEQLGYESTIPERLFTPSNNNKVSSDVITRWKRNLEYLQMIKNKNIPTSFDEYQKVINSNRIKDLEEAILKSQD